MASDPKYVLPMFFAHILRAAELLALIDTQGVKIRTLKGAAGADPKAVEAEVAELLKLKEEYTKLTGQEVPGAKPTKKKEKAEKKEEGGDGSESKQAKGKKGKVKVTEEKTEESKEPKESKESKESHDEKGEEKISKVRNCPHSSVSNFCSARPRLLKSKATTIRRKKVRQAYLHFNNPKDFSFPAAELEILKYWEDIKAFETSLKFSEGRPE